MKLKGQVIAKQMHTGSKSEGVWPCLLTSGGKTYKIRRANRDDYRDSELLSLEGQTIRAEGTKINDNLFVIDTYEIESA